jgi:dienelactone hydrolase
VKAATLVLVLALGCTSPPGAEWDGVVTAARALRPAIPAGDAAILDGLDARARDSLLALRHPDDRKSWEAAVPKIRRELRRSLGLDLLPEARPRELRSVGVISREGYRIEKLVYETLPSTEVPAHLYLPALSEGKIPAILFVPGHWYADSKVRPEFQSFAIMMARRGLAVLTYDPFGQGERGISVRDHRRTELLAAGVAQEAIVAFESLCALEVLLARPEVDPARVGMTGASGGGFNSWILPALEPRISVTVPVVGTSDFLEQLRAVRNVDWFAAKEHCHFIPRLLRYADNHELLACVAPRPVLVISAHNDLGFPVPGQRAVVKYGKTLYAALGAAGQVGYFEDIEEGHGYQKRKREAAYGWLLKWLKGEGDGQPVEEPALEVAAWDSPDLRCFPVGQNRLAGPGMNALAKAIAARERAPARETDHQPQRELCTTLGISYPLPLPLAPDLMGMDPRLSLGGTPDARLRGWRMPDGVFIPALLLRPRGTNRGALLVVGDGGKEAMLEHPAVREAYAAGWAVVLADLRGTGELAVTKPGWVYAASLLLGENFVGRQALDLVAGVRATRAEPWLLGKRVAVLASGRFASLAGLYASVWEPEIAWLAAEHGFASFRAFLDRPLSNPLSFSLAAPGKEREVALDREIPHAIIPFGVLRGTDIPEYLQSIGRARSVWAAAVDGDFEPVPGPSSTLDFIRARMEEAR